jgi:hypothetical protein
MIATFTALLFAHVLADFVLQSGWMVRNKRRPVALLAHIAVVLATAVAATGSAGPELLALAAAHLLFDVGKTFSGKDGVGPFLLDQAAHLASLIAVVLLAPDLWVNGAWAGFPALLPLMALASGLILATRAGGFAVGMLMEPWSEASPKGLPGGGRAIGTLERGLIFVLILTGQPQGIGFLIAAKSVLRFGAVGDDRAVSEYVIIGTLASFGWAITVGFATVHLMALLPPLGIPGLAP